MSKLKTTLAVLATIAVSTSAMAATTGTLILKGTVPQELSIEVEAEAVAAALPLDTTQTDTLVAVVTEKSNSNTGYNVSISSDNSGELVHETVSSSSIAYTLKYDGSAIDLSSGDNFVHSFPTGASNDRDIEISYTGVPHADLVEGDYTDTVTFTIAAN